jgi:hypothetical protein
MSADNWTRCPKCYRDFLKTKEAALAKAHASYGKVPAEDFVTALRKAEALTFAQGSSTLREDYEIGINQAGVFTVEYGAGCQACGAVFTFKHVVDVVAKGSLQ